MVKRLEEIVIGKTPAVISEVYDENHVEVVYNSGVKNVYEKAHLTGGSWEFDDPGLSAGYADGVERLVDAVVALETPPHVRHLKEQARRQPAIEEGDNAHRTEQ